jgi:hypothetical protein
MANGLAPWTITFKASVIISNSTFFLDLKASEKDIFMFIGKQTLKRNMMKSVWSSCFTYALINFSRKAFIIPSLLDMMLMEWSKASPNNLSEIISIWDYKNVV